MVQVLEHEASFSGLENAVRVGQRGRGGGESLQQFPDETQSRCIGRLSQLFDKIDVIFQFLRPKGLRLK